MILDDLFEQKPLPPHIKPSDLPPAMRSRQLTMRDIEAERPKGAYRYRVGDKQFLDLRSAQEFATGTGQGVMPIKEQADDPDVQRGMTNLNAIEKQLNTNMKVVLQNETGQPAYQIELPVDKQWLISHAQEWIDAGKSSDLYKLMGTNKGFEFLLAAWQKEDVIRAKRQQDVRPEEPDLFGSGQSGKPKSTRYQDEGQHGQKKRTELDEAPAGASARTERMMAQMRARQPQATSDLEAMAYELQDAERRDAEEINKLEKDVDSLETDIKQDLQKRIASLTRRRGGIRQAAVQDTKTDAVLDQLAKVNDEQQREINNLERAVASLADRSRSIPGVAVQATTKPEQPAAKPAPVTPSPIGVTAPTATKPAIATVSPSKPDIKKSDAASDVGTTDLRQKFGIPKAQDTEYQQVAEAPLGELKSTLGLGEKKDRSPGKISKSEDPCWSGYHMVGTKKKGGRTVPNCVPGAKGAANESLREISEQAALAKLRTREHPAFQMFVESWYRAHGGV